VVDASVIICPWHAKHDFTANQQAINAKHANGAELIGPSRTNHRLRAHRRPEPLGAVFRKFSSKKSQERVSRPLDRTETFACFAYITFLHLR
jgi:hypothetical protein